MDYKDFDTEDELVAHIAACNDIQEELVEIPEWGIRVLVRGMTAAERNSILQAHMDRVTGLPNMVLAYPDMVIASCYHPKTKKRLFKPAHRGMLNEKAGGSVDRITNAITRLSGLGAEGLELARKNSK